MNRLALPLAFVAMLFLTQVALVGAASTAFPCTGTSLSTIVCGTTGGNFITNATIDIPQNTLVTVNDITGGTGSYTANFILSNTVVSFNTLALSGISAGSSITLLVNSITASGFDLWITTNSNPYTGPVDVVANTIATPWTINATITDTGSNTFETNAIPTFTIYPTLTFLPPNPPTLTNSTIDVGQSSVFSTGFSGGSGGVRAQCGYNQMSGNTPSDVGCSEGSLVSPFPTTITAVASNTLIINDGSIQTLYLPAGNTIFGAWTFNTELTDQGISTQVTINTLETSALTINPALTPPTTPLLSVKYNGNQVDGNVMDADQQMQVGVDFSGGTTPYTCNMIIAYSANSVVVASQQFSPVSSSCSSTFANLPVGSLYANVIITDGATTPEVVNSINEPFTVWPQLGTPLTPVLSGNDIEYTGSALGSQTTTAITNIIGGTVPYTYNFIVAYASNDVVFSNFSQSTNSFTDRTLQAAPPGNYVMNVIVTDNAVIPENTVSTRTANIIVKMAPTFASFIPSNSVLNSGQTETYSFTVDNGFGPFTVQLYNNTKGSFFGGNALISSPGGSNSLSFTSGATGTFNYEVFATDLGASTPYTVSSSSNTITVNAAPTTTTIPSATTTIPVYGTGGGGQSSTVTTTTTTNTTSTTTIHTIFINNTHVNITLNLSSNGTALNLNNGKIILALFAPHNGMANVTITNVTSNSTAPGNMTKLSVFNVSVHSNPKQNVTIVLQLRYNCSVPQNKVVPYILINGTWTPIVPFTVNPSTCTVKFTITSDPVVGLFESPTPVTSTSTIISTTSVATTTSAVLPPSPSSANNTIYAVVVIVVIVIIAAAYALTRSKKRSVGWPKKR